MSEFVYSYNIAESFPTGFDSDSININIKEDSVIGSRYMYLTTNSVIVYFYFNEELTSGDIIILNNIIAENKKIIFYNESQLIRFSANKDEVTTSDYTQIASLVFLGEYSLGTTSHFEIVASKSIDTFEYNSEFDLKLINVSNGNEVIFEETGYVNTSIEVLSITNFSNMPKNMSILLLMGRIRNGEPNVSYLKYNLGMIVMNQ